MGQVQSHSEGFSRAVPAVCMGSGWHWAGIAAEGALHGHCGARGIARACTVCIAARRALHGHCGRGTGIHWVLQGEGLPCSCLSRVIFLDFDGVFNCHSNSK